MKLNLPYGNFSPQDKPTLPSETESGKNARQNNSLPKQYSKKTPDQNYAQPKITLSLLVE